MGLTRRPVALRPRLSTGLPFTVESNRPVPRVALSTNGRARCGVVAEPDLAVADRSRGCRTGCAAAIRPTAAARIRAPPAAHPPRSSAARSSSTCAMSAMRPCDRRSASRDNRRCASRAPRSGTPASAGTGARGSSSHAGSDACAGASTARSLMAQNVTTDSIRRVTARRRAHVRHAPLVGHGSAQTRRATAISRTSSSV